jgi:DNA-directed RNA polymerase subunit RPC12/RpoP
MITFLRGPIPSNKTVVVQCQGPCGRTHVLWSPTVTGVLKCPYCNTRLLTENTEPFPTH